MPCIRSAEGCAEDSVRAAACRAGVAGSEAATGRLVGSVGRNHGRGPWTRNLTESVPFRRRVDM